MKLIIFITARTDKTLDVAEAWQNAGSSGVTILEGHGLGRLQDKISIRDDLPLIPSLATLLEQQEIDTHILVSAVKDTIASQLYQITVDIVGELLLPNNGFICTLDIGSSLGLPYQE